MSKTYRPVTESIDKRFLVKQLEEQIEIISGNEYEWKPLKGVDPTTNLGDVALTPANCIDIGVLLSYLGRYAQDNYFICRVIAPWLTMNGHITIVDDPKGEFGLMLILYNYPLNNSDIGSIFPVGSKLIINHPWFKETVDGRFALRCDGPNNVIPATEQIFRSIFPGGVRWKADLPEQYRAKSKKTNKKPEVMPDVFYETGVNLREAKAYEEALKCFSRGLEKFPNHVGLLIRRCETYYCLGRYHLAVADADTALKIDHLEVEAILQKARSLVMLKRCEEARKFVKKTQTLDFTDTMLIKRFLITLDEICEQAKKGNHDIVYFIHPEIRGHETCADYTGPLKVTEERSIVAAEDILPGKLIIVSNAFDIIFMEDCAAGEDVHSTLVKQVVRHLEDELQRRKEVYDLHAERADINAPVNEEHIGVILKQCAFITTAAKIEHQCDSLGLWVLPSYLNHSCVDCNCTWMTVRGKMFVRSTRFIAKGEELRINLVDPLASYETRTAGLKLRGRVCDCRLCSAERSESTEIRNIQVEFYKLVVSETVAKLEMALENLEKINEMNPVLNLHNVEILKKLGMLHMKDYNIGNAIRVFKKAYELLKGVPLVLELTSVLVALVHCFTIVQSITPKENNIWIDILKDHLILNWGSLSAFNLLTPDLENVFGKKIVDDISKKIL